MSAERKFHKALEYLAEQLAEKISSDVLGKALTEKNGFIAALEALCHPKTSFSATREAGVRYVE
jgi:hypothetical protein